MLQAEADSGAAAASTELAAERDRLAAELQEVQAALDSMQVTAAMPVYAMFSADDLCSVAVRRHREEVVSSLVV